MSRSAQSPRSLLLAVEGLSLATASTLPALQPLLERSAQAMLGLPLPHSRVAAQGTLMTGQWPDQHGLLVAVMPDSDGTRRPVEAGDRTRPTIWELLALHGLATIAVGWPALAGNALGATIDAGFGSPLEPVPDAAGLARVASLQALAAAPLAECWMMPGELDLEALTALVPDWEKVRQSHDPRLAKIAGAVSQNVSRHAAFLELLASDEWDAAGLFLDLPAELARIEKNQPDAISAGLAERGLLLLDAFVAAILGALPENVRLVICGLPDSEANLAEEEAFAFFHGPGIAAGASASGGSLLDFAPTLARIHGFTMPGTAGRPLVELFQDYPLLRDFSAPWPQPALLPALPGRPPVEPGWLIRWQIITLQIRARSLMSRSEWLAAIPLLESQLRLQPDSVSLLMLLVECQYFAGLHRDALENAWDLMQVADAADPLPLLMVAGLEAINGDFPKGRRYLDEAAPLVTKRPAARLFQGRVLVHLRQWQDAKATLEALIADEPKNAAALGQLARTYLGLGQWQEACDFALQANALNLHDATVHEVLGVSLLKMGLKEEAWSAFKAATDTAPSWPRPWAWLAHLAKNLGRPQAEVERLTSRYRELTRKAAARAREISGTNGSGTNGTNP